ncbi:hypothetical protein IMZ48_30935 [Candidatus Bathyarchaeota archaeon]|nr:hypothetical protein [Candidatus Bathyarchaeota archaeon]
MRPTRLLAQFATAASAAVLPFVGPNDTADGRSRGGVASQQAECSEIGRNALVRGVSPLSSSTYPTPWTLLGSE